MSEGQLPDFIKALLHKEIYPHRAEEITLVQTHISYVLLAGDFVYKIKKPIDFGFLNFSTLEKRKFFCEEELRLNRRLCPTIYLETLPIKKLGDEYNINGSGSLIDYCVKMQRMPEEKMMANVIKAGQLSKSSIDKIVEVIEPFYGKAEGGEEISSYGAAEAVAVNVKENFTQTEQFVGCDALSQEEFDTIQDYSMAFLQKTEIFDERIAAKRIKECHGDLHSGNICMADKVYIYDCIEFNNRFRYSDIACDLAFLAMDLDSNNLTDLSNYLIERYCKDSGDKSLMGVLNFYKCYRASVRGKIGLLTAHEEEVDDITRESALKQAKNYYLLAQSYADKCRSGRC